MKGNPCSSQVSLCSVIIESKPLEAKSWSLHRINSPRFAEQSVENKDYSIQIKTHRPDSEGECLKQPIANGEFCVLV